MGTEDQKQIHVKENASVLLLKQEIQNSMAIPLDHQRLIYQGRVLQDGERKLSDLGMEGDRGMTWVGIDDGKVVHLVVREENGSVGADSPGNETAERENERRTSSSMRSMTTNVEGQPVLIAIRIESDIGPVNSLQSAVDGMMNAFRNVISSAVNNRESATRNDSGRDTASTASQERPTTRESTGNRAESQGERSGIISQVARTVDEVISESRLGTFNVEREHENFGYLVTRHLERILRVERALNGVAQRTMMLIRQRVLRMNSGNTEEIFRLLQGIRRSYSRLGDAWRQMMDVLHFREENGELICVPVDSRNSPPGRERETSTFGETFLQWLRSTLSREQLEEQVFTSSWNIHPLFRELLEGVTVQDAINMFQGSHELLEKKLLVLESHLVTHAGISASLSITEMKERIAHYVESNLLSMYVPLVRQLISEPVIFLLQRIACLLFIFQDSSLVDTGKEVGQYFREFWMQISDKLTNFVSSSVTNTMQSILSDILRPFAEHNVSSIVPIIMSFLSSRLFGNGTGSSPGTSSTGTDSATTSSSGSLKRSSEGNHARISKKRKEDNLTSSSTSSSTPSSTSTHHLLPLLSSSVHNAHLSSESLCSLSSSVLSDIASQLQQDYLHCIKKDLEKKFQ